MEILGLQLTYLARFGLLCYETSAFSVVHGSRVTNMADIYSLKFEFLIQHSEFKVIKLYLKTLVLSIPVALIQQYNIARCPGALVHLVH